VSHPTTENQKGNLPIDLILMLTENSQLICQAKRVRKCKSVFKFFIAIKLREEKFDRSISIAINPREKLERPVEFSVAINRRENSFELLRFVLPHINADRK
jgi:hypothetical protein